MAMWENFIKSIL